MKELSTIWLSEVSKSKLNTYSFVIFSLQTVDVAPLVPELANFFDDVLNKSVSELNLKVTFLLSFSKICGQMQLVINKLLFGLVMFHHAINWMQSWLLVELSLFSVSVLYAIAGGRVRLMKLWESCQKRDTYLLFKNQLDSVWWLEDLQKLSARFLQSSFLDLLQDSFELTQA